MSMFSYHGKLGWIFPLEKIIDSQSNLQPNNTLLIVISLNNCDVTKGVFCCSREMSRYGIRVSIIEPGGFQTNILDMASYDVAKQRQWEEAPQHVKEEYGDDYLQLGKLAWMQEKTMKSTLK